MTDFIPFALHDIGEEEIAEVVDTLKSNWITTGPKVKVFEDDFSRYVGSKFAIAVNSATSGLHLALECMGARPNDKVITTPYTFTATAEVIRYLNADPVLIDINEEDLNINAEKVEDYCRDACDMKDGTLYDRESGAPVRAIIPVHIGGVPCDMDRIAATARKYNLKVVEDAAHALPSQYKGRRVGAISDITVFSFYATKTITTAEGGMVVTDNQEYYSRMKVMGFHGIDRSAWDRYSSNTPKWYYEVVEAGFKYNMTDIAASLGIVQLRRADQFYARRKKIASIYNRELSGIRDLFLPRFDPSDDSRSWHLYPVRIRSKRISRDAFIEMLHREGVGSSVHFIPLHIHPYYSSRYNYGPEDFPVALRCFKEVASLPIYTKLTDDDVVRISQTIRKVLA